MKKDNSESPYWEDDFDRKKKKVSTKKSVSYKRKYKYKDDYLNEESYQ
tara:strand:+ start:439 stop:582 length:144 start_codon:yes stop_codon:yes gene_type:complete